MSDGAGQLSGRGPAVARLIACPECDLLIEAAPLAPGERGRCGRCHHLLYAPRIGAFARIVSLALTVAVLMAGALFFPFLTVTAGGLSNASSIFSTALAYSQGWLAPLAGAVLLLIVLLPVFRVLALLYALGPVAAGHAARPGALGAFRLASAVKPWAMAEVFVVGTVVALVKVGGLAEIGLGPAFWAFALLVVVAAAMDSLARDWTLWDVLDG